MKHRTILKLFRLHAARGFSSLRRSCPHLLDHR